MKFWTGVIIGMLLTTGANYFGEQRYSDAIRECIKTIGVNE